MFLKSQEDLAKYKWSCMFGEVEVPAEVLANNVIQCHAPHHKVGRIPFYVTCSNRVACSEVREFEFRVNRTQDFMMTGPNSVGTSDMLLNIRFQNLLSLGSVCHIGSVEIDGENSHRSGSIKLMMKEDDEGFLMKVTKDGKGPNLLDKEGQGVVIHLAGALGYDWVIAPTVAADVNINFRDMNGWAALHWATFCGRCLFERLTTAIHNVTQATARIHQVYKIQSFQRKQLVEYDDKIFGMSDERALSLISIKKHRLGLHDEPVHVATMRIHNKFHGWKGRKEFLVIRQRIIKIQVNAIVLLFASTPQSNDLLWVLWELCGLSRFCWPLALRHFPEGGKVSHFIIGGAYLMFPGISIPAEGVPPFQSGQPWAVIVPNNVAPIAVGTTTMSSTEALKAGLRGKALLITHYYRDSLWQFSTLSPIKQKKIADELDRRTPQEILKKLEDVQNKIIGIGFCEQVLRPDLLIDLVVDLNVQIPVQFLEAFPLLLPH
ncbi:hypothetical protein IFM89_017384 [Coptis chinensis]|uniref:Eukaryotic translation initiation factor 2D-like PUA RNA-binding domain-containing protein n=1 Tax=Coptis chinensis TaxID=261450 RepID=A0A835HKK4_9MAGN|nr:hypothetical protein IFM89_017384 [Coptis chinensis]